MAKKGKAKTKKKNNVVVLKSPKRREDVQAFLDQAYEVAQIMEEHGIGGYVIYAFNNVEEEEGATLYDYGSFKRGDINPYLFPSVIKSVLERNT